MTYGPVTIECGIEPCPRRMHFDFASAQSANRAARERGWTIVQNRLVRCPGHRLAAAPVRRRGGWRRPERFDDATEQRIAKEYAAGLGSTTLGRKYGRTPTDIRDIVLRRGGTMRPSGTRDGKR
jgi:hypothetical protein